MLWIIVFIVLTAFIWIHPVGYIVRTIRKPEEKKSDFEMGVTIVVVFAIGIAVLYFISSALDENDKHRYVPRDKNYKFDPRHPYR